MSLQENYNANRHSDIGLDEGGEFTHNVLFIFRHKDNGWENKFHVEQVNDGIASFPYLVEQFEVFLKGTLYNWSYDVACLSPAEDSVDALNSMNDPEYVVTRLNMEDVDDYVIEIIASSNALFSDSVYPQRSVYSIPASCNIETILRMFSLAMRGIGYSYLYGVYLFPALSSSRNPNNGRDGRNEEDPGNEENSESHTTPSGASRTSRTSRTSTEGRQMELPNFIEPFSFHNQPAYRTTEHLTDEQNRHREILNRGRVELNGDIYGDINAVYGYGRNSMPSSSTENPENGQGDENIVSPVLLGSDRSKKT